MSTAVTIIFGAICIASVAVLAAEIREQRKTIERLVQKCCDLPEDAAKGTKPRVISPYIDEKTEDEA